MRDRERERGKQEELSAKKTGNWKRHKNKQTSASFTHRK